MKRLALFLVFLIASSYLWAQWRPETVPNPLETGQSFIADPDRLLSPEEKAAFNQMAYQLDDSAKVQFTVVVLQSIDASYDPFDFGVALFNHWRIGHNDRGLLLLIIMDTHDWRFHTGYGLEDIITDAIARRIGENDLVPYFRDEQYGQGILAATHTLSDLLMASDVRAAIAQYEQAERESELEEQKTMVYLFWGILAVTGLLLLITKRQKVHQYHGFYDITLVDGRLAKMTLHEQKSLRRPKRHIEYFIYYSLFSLIIPFAVGGDLFTADPAGNFFIAAYIWMSLSAVVAQICISRSAAKQSHNNIEHALLLQGENRYLIVRILIQPLIFLPYYFIYKKRLNKLKDGANLPCPFCHSAMHKASAQTWQSTLSDIQKTEQRMGIFDYRLLECPHGHLAEIDYRGRLYATYGVCKHCGAKAVIQNRSYVVKKPTYLSTGLNRTDYTCQYCHHTSFKTTIVPRLIAAAAAAGAGSRRGGSFGSFGGGRSFGGGFTGGGGAGGKW